MTDRVQQILKAAELLRKGDVASGMKQILGATEGTALGGIKGLDFQIVSQALAQPHVAALPSPAAALQLQLQPAALPALPAPAPALGQAAVAGGTTALALVGGAPTGAALSAPTAAGLTASPALTAGLQATAPAAAAGTELLAGVVAVPSQGQAPLPLPGAPTVDKLPPGIDPERLRLAQAVGTMRLRMIQEAAQQQYLAAYTQQVMEVQQLHEKQQEAAQLALIMEAAEAQAEMAKQSLEEDKEEHHWHRRIGRNVAVCGHWQRGHCSRGDSCQFAHPEKEKGTLQTRGPAEIMRHNFKTVLCKFHANGNCPQGARCMFAHGPQDLRSPGMSLHKDEEEIVQRVAAARTGKAAPGAGAAQTAGAAAPTLVAPPGDLTARLAALQLSTLAGLRGTAITGAAQQGQAGDQALQLDSAQLLALAQLSDSLRAAGVAVDASSLGLVQLAPAGVGLTTAAAPATAGLQAATAAPVAVGLAPGGGLLQGTATLQGLTASAAPGMLATAVPPPPPPAAVQPAPLVAQGLVTAAPFAAAKAADGRPALLPGQQLVAQPLTLQTLAAQPLAAQQFAAQPLAAQPFASQPPAAQQLVAQPSALAQQPLAGQLFAVQQQFPAQPLAAQLLAAQQVVVGAPGVVATAVAPGLGAAAVGQPAPAAPQPGGLPPLGATTAATSAATSAATAPTVWPALARPQLSASALELLARYAQQGGESPAADQESKRLRLG